MDTIDDLPKLTRWEALQADIAATPLPAPAVERARSVGGQLAIELSMMALKDERRERYEEAAYQADLAGNSIKARYLMDWANSV